MNVHEDVRGNKWRYSMHKVQSEQYSTSGSAMKTVLGGHWRHDKTYNRLQKHQDINKQTQNRCTY